MHYWAIYLYIALSHKNFAMSELIDIYAAHCYAIAAKYSLVDIFMYFEATFFPLPISILG